MKPVVLEKQHWNITAEILFNKVNKSLPNILLLRYVFLERKLIAKRTFSYIFKANELELLHFVYNMLFNIISFANGLENPISVSQNCLKYPLKLH